MSKEQFLSSGLLEQYVLGLTSPEETKEVEAYIKKYPELQEEVEGMRHAIEQYALQHSIPPPPHLRDNIIKEINPRSTGRVRTEASGLAYERFGWPILLAGLFAISFGLLSAYLFRMNNNQRQELQGLQVEYALYRESCEAQKEQAQRLDRVYAFLTDQHTMPVRLQGTNLSPRAEAIVYWNPQVGEAYFNNLNLPEPPQGKQYQIWADVEGEMINMGLLETGGSRLQSIGYIDDAESLNITLEPLGGSPHPTVELLYANGAI